MSRRAVIALGVAQCLNWGVLYYAFTVLVLPVSADLAVQPWVVAGAFSLSLLVSALLSPAVGAWTDGGAGGRLMQAGGWAAAALLAAWTLAPSLPMVYAVWLGLGGCMAATLYEPAFAIVGRAVPNPSERLRALALVTVIGGVASTIFLPVTDVLVRAIGWRPTVAALAAILVASTVLTRIAVPRDARRDPAIAPVAATPAPGAPSRRVFGWTLATFAFASFASAALTANLIPALGERHVGPSTAALLGGLFGLMQLPGRLLLTVGGTAGSPLRLIVVSLLLQAGGLLGFGAAASVATTAGSLVIFAAGAGLATLARPHFLQTRFGAHASAHLSGRIARWQQVARSAGPITAAGLAAWAGYAAVVAGLGAVFVVLAIGSRRALGGEPGADRAAA